MKLIHYYTIIIAQLLIGISGCKSSYHDNDKPLYLNPEIPVEQRTEDLMSRMTLKEKIGQMCQYVAIEHFKHSQQILQGKISESNDQYGYYPDLTVKDIKDLILKGEIGSFLHAKDLNEATELQKTAMLSRLKIPLLFGIDAIHGHAIIEGTTVYPTQLSLSSTWNNALLYKIAKETAQEVRATGMHWTFSPNVEVARDSRWGRTGETFGEDPYLVSRMGVAFTKGYQGNFGNENILACAKHFVGGGEPFNGTNAAPIDVSERQLREIWFPSFKAQVDAGVYTFMAAHNEVTGVPAHGNKYLLNDILRKEWGFKGFVVSDWMDIERLYDLHHIATTPEEAIKISVEAGLDMHMHGPGFLEPVYRLVKNGEIPENVINKSVSKILKAKFILGLFEHPYADKTKATKIILSEEHKKTALKAARESIILLKNEGRLLPFRNKKKILITGPNANNERIMGDWVIKQPDKNIITPYEGMKMIFNDCTVDFISSGENMLFPDYEKMKLPVAKASEYDVVVVVVGSNSLRYQNSEKTCGENIDRANIDLPGNQLKLIKEIYAKNKNIVVVLVNGRPLGEPWIKENIPAIIEAWEPGAFGGQAIAEVIKGDINPSGKLTISIPYSSGQIAYFYNHKPSSFFHPYRDVPSKPLWYFGYGQSYTTYKYSDLAVPEKANIRDTIRVSVKVTNKGKMDGDEIVQLYIRDDYSSVTRPVKELKGYKRVHLKSDETKKVYFKLPFSAFAFYNLDMKYVVEPGTFTIMVGSSSKDEDLLKETLTIN